MNNSEQLNFGENCKHRMFREVHQATWNQYAQWVVMSQRDHMYHMYHILIIIVPFTQVQPGIHVGLFVTIIMTLEVDECSAGGDSGAEEDEDDASSRGSRSNSSSSSISGSSTSTDSGDDSGEEHGTSGSETHSSGEEDDEENDNTEYSVKAESPDTLKWETCIAANIKIKLPQDLCEHAAIFKEFLDYSYIWNECLTESQRETLCNLLPVFPKDCDVEAETEKTLRMLFERENHRFGVAPLDAFHSHLSAGHYRPDIRRMCSLVRKAQQRRLLFEERKRSYELASQLLKSRESLLSNAYKQGFCQPVQRTMSKIQWRKPKPAMVEEKTQLRYLEELNALRTELGASAKLAADTTSENEENYPHYQLSGAKQKKKKRSLMGAQGLSIRGLQINHEDETIRPVFSTLQRAEYPANRSLFVREQTEEMYREMLLEHKKRRARRDIHPELNTQGIALADLTQRAQIGQKHKLSLGPAIRITPAKKRIKLEHSPLCPPAPRLTNSIKHESDNSDYSHTTDENRHSNALDMDHRMLTPIKSEPMDAYEMHQMSKKKLSPVALKGGKTSMMAAPEIKKEVEDMEYDDIKTELGTGVNEDPPLETEEEEENDKKELDLDSIDMMQLPIQLDDGIDILDDVKCEDEGVISIPDKEIAVPSNEDAMDINSGAELMQETHACFFSLLRDAFTSKGEYRMSAGEMKDAVTQWQGNPISPLNDWYSLASSWPALVPLALGFLAGELTYSQDSDRQEKESELVPYLENKGSGVYAWIGAGRDSDSRLSDLCVKFLMHKDSLDSSSPAMESINVDGTSVNTVAEWEPPRALWPTEWKVRPSTMEEREEFRRQERMRYAAPHKAFTYRMHGYASVVGPVKGIYQHNVALVRDATARLPNGEGTRADICQLLKDSQYIREQTESDDKEGYLHSVVSGALDRLHYETDPCVRYYPRRKEWLYLHRARSESEFEMYHQQLQGVAKNKKNGGSMSRKALPPVIKPTNVNKEQSPSNNKEATPKKERKAASAIQPVISRKEQKKTEEKNINDHSVTAEQPAVITNIVTTINTPTTSVISMSGTTVPVTSLPTSSTSINTITVEKDIATTMDVKPQITANVPAKKATNIVANISSGQIKSLLTGHGLQGQTIFIKQSSPSGNQSQQIQQQQLKIGGKPIAVQIQQSPHQQQQQKILAKVLTSSGSGQLISVENLLAQKGLKLATTTSHANQLGRQGKQVIQTQYQVVSQAQTSSGQSKIIASTQQQPQPQQAQTVRMVTAQLAGKPIVLASGNKNVGVGVSSSGSVVLGKQQSSQQQTQQQPIILPSQLLNIKTLHGLKVIPTPAGLKTTGAAVYARVIAPTTITSSQSTGNQQQTMQTQPSRNNTYSAP
ncbi:Nuclear factor related to kappa-B-binding protein [Melipona quadrifasciata]|uniref:Nuclear factor related to kappa-B-binding protein n=1 Tax=Melipona quadrifasciata TaxID=166423 RepID=A0A0M8ZY44_9HYME|nr:Nuclear factor related to kappa-B-binding protein [Melipona quadrifasciata]